MHFGNAECVRFKKLVFECRQFPPLLPTMASAKLECVCCGRKGFKSERGLTQHQKQNLPCKEHMLLKSRGKTVSTSFHAVFKYVPVNASNSQQKSDQLLAKNGSTYVNSSPSLFRLLQARSCPTTTQTWQYEIKPITSYN